MNLLLGAFRAPIGPNSNGGSYTKHPIEEMLRSSVNGAFFCVCKVLVAHESLTLAHSVVSHVSSCGEIYVRNKT